jgi:hypothetical protein
MSQKKSYLSKAVLCSGALIALSTLFCMSAAAQSVQAGYKLSTFATGVSGANGFSQPDSLVRWRNSILVGYQNHVAKDGTDGGFSTIVQYSLDGAIQRAFAVKGHNDGLRVIGEDDLWAIQNEDGNPNLAVIDLSSGKQKVYTFPEPTPHGGGYDDLRVKDGQVLVTASNPSGNPNTAPALVRVQLDGNTLDVEPVLYANAAATNIPSGAPVTLNLQDPDSLSIDPRGVVLLDDQADGQLILIRNPFSQNPTVGQLTLTNPANTTENHSTTIDDTAFPVHANDFLLVSDVGGNTVYRIDAPLFGFEPGKPYSASDSEGYVAGLNLDNGVLAPIATGFVSMRGMLFVSQKSSEDDGEEHHHER